MKCIKIRADQFGTVAKHEAHLMVVLRTDNTTAFDKVHRGPWKYATRKQWKAGGRKEGQWPLQKDY